MLKTYAQSYKNKKNPEKKNFLKKAWVKKTLKACVIVFLLGMVGVVGFFGWLTSQLPSPDKIQERLVTESTKIYANDGTTILYETGRDVRRTKIGLKDVPQNVKSATIALEDKNFYTHSGFSIKGILRSVYLNIFKGERVGGSTITQQFVKLAVLGPEKTLTRKIKEFIFAVELERRYSKDEILEMYLNEIPYGGINYGIAAAASSYYHKEVKDLTLGEAATLASLPRLPNYYLSNIESLKNRRDYALDRMAEDGYITQEEADAAKEELLQLQSPITNITAPHFVFYVLSLLEEKYGSSYVNQGLRVITTLDAEKQKIAEKAVQNGMAKIQSRGGSNAALVSLDTKTGHIIAMVGGADFWDQENGGQVNVAVSPRQPGSSFKPIVYYTAFQKGYTPETIIFDLETDFNGYRPNNYTGESYGPVMLRKALAGSLNISAVKTLYLAGIPSVMDTAKNLGYTTITDPDNYGLSLALGAAEVTLLEHVSAFATFAREGVRHKPTALLKVESSNGKVLEDEEWKDNEQEVLDKQSVKKLTSVLTDNDARSFIFGSTNWLTLPGRQVAAKTGTTNDNKDGWTMGYTPSFATGVWIGNNDGSKMMQGADGGSTAAPIWNEYMQKILEGTPQETFKSPEPEDIEKAVLKGEAGETIQTKIDIFSGKAIPEECIETYPAQYVVEKSYKIYHDILHYVDKKDPRGQAPKNPSDDPLYTAWETPVQEWSKSQPDTLPAILEYESCSFRNIEKEPSVSILSPEPREDVSSKTLLFKVQVTPATGYRLSKIVFTVDVVKIDEQVLTGKKQSLITSNFKPTNLTEGKHVLTATVFDEEENQSSASVSFTFKQ